MPRLQNVVEWSTSHQITATLHTFTVDDHYKEVILLDETKWKNFEIKWVIHIFLILKAEWPGRKLG